MSRLPRFKANTPDILTKAWSIRLMVLAFIFTALETMLPFMQGWLPVPDQVFGILSGVCVAGAFVARLLVQTDLAG